MTYTNGETVEEKKRRLWGALRARRFEGKGSEGKGSEGSSSEGSKGVEGHGKGVEGFDDLRPVALPRIGKAQKGVEGDPPEGPPEALEAAGASDERAVSRSGSRRAPRARGPSQMWFEALEEAHVSLEEEGVHPRGRVRQRAREILKQWKKGNKHCKVERRKNLRKEGVEEVD